MAQFLAKKFQRLTRPGRATLPRRTQMKKAYIAPIEEKICAIPEILDSGDSEAQQKLTSHQSSRREPTPKPESPCRWRNCASWIGT